MNRLELKRELGEIEDDNDNNNNDDMKMDATDDNDDSESSMVILNQINMEKYDKKMYATVYYYIFLLFYKHSNIYSIM